MSSKREIDILLDSSPKLKATHLTKDSILQGVNRALSYRPGNVKRIHDPPVNQDDKLKEVKEVKEADKPKSRWECLELE